MGVELGYLPLHAHIDSLAGGTKKLNSDQNALSVSVSTNQSLENIALNEVSPECMDTDISSVLVSNIDTREKFCDLYFEAFYSLYLDLFARMDEMLLSDEYFRDKEMYGGIY